MEVPSFPLVGRWLLAYFAWQFFATGAVLVVGGILKVLEAQAEAIVLLPVGVFLLSVGERALDFLRANR